jgi:hypothetical protein
MAAEASVEVVGDPTVAEDPAEAEAEAAEVEAATVSQQQSQP